eukprot:CAMPEP_0177615986 /NCGR_PEP_ID=MMETSP0419_2-20121207/23841_1 /TAXON_ID=582737 /ORGANISM="Tetraselmis sp., Strain GSL018" /LENGTH=849 /DNA_ID=CAMNT_0019113867 /DNA_START=777 /DNA_END=3326 /DNA_ORIENTATION=-
MACVSCKYPRFWDGERCACPAAVPEGARCTVAGDIVSEVLQRTAVSYEVVFRDVPRAGGAINDVTVGASAILSDMLERSAADCYETGGREACNALANLCVLQLHSRDSIPCQLYQELVDSRGDMTYHDGSLGDIEWSYSLPWLFYPRDVETFLRSNNVKTRVRFGGGGGGSDSDPIVSKLSFRLARYALNGTFLGWQRFEKQFQLCGGFKAEQDLWTSVAVNYRNRCKVAMQDLLYSAEGQHGPEFVDIYLEDGKDSLYPVPIVIENFPDNEDASIQPELLTRRFFLVDAVSGIESQASPGSEPLAIRYLSKFHLELTLQDGGDRGEDGHIYPPVARIRYEARDPQEARGVENPAEFRVSYVVEESRILDFINTWDYMIIASMLAGLIIGLMKLYRYTKVSRSSEGNEGNEMELLFELILTGTDVGSAALFFVLFFITLYWVCFFKLQASVHTILPADDGEIWYRFRVCVICTTVGRAASVLWMMWRQTSVDIFLLDWTEPKERVANKGDPEHSIEEAPISCWRTIFTANEWNELQTLRKTSLEFTMFMVVLLLEGIGLQNGAEVNPDAGDISKTRVVETSQLLRFGITSVVFLLVEVFGIVALTLLRKYYLGDPLCDFVDLLWLSNISVLILDNCAGYYLHGKFTGPDVDTDIEGLKVALVSEVSNLRGFSQDDEVQTYMIFVPSEFRSKLSSFLRKVEDKHNRDVLDYAMRGPQDVATDAALQEKCAELQRELRKEFESIRGKFSEHIRIPSLTSHWTQIPPNDSMRDTVLWEDRWNAFGGILFYGNELSLFMLQVMIFTVIDLRAKSATFSGAITYLVMRLLSFVRDQWGKDNLSKKALIDRRFLI